MRVRVLDLCCATAVAVVVACGASGSRTDTGQESQAVAFTECLRSHGLPTFPDPTGAATIRIPNTIDPDSPAFKDAAGACKRYWPTNATGAQAPTESAKLEMLAVSMRAHGDAGFPDPTSSPPTTPAPPGGVNTGRGGVYFIVPPSAGPASPGFGAAARACRFAGRTR